MAIAREVAPPATDSIEHMTLWNAAEIVRGQVIGLERQARELLDALGIQHDPTPAGPDRITRTPQSVMASTADDLREIERLLERLASFIGRSGQAPASAYPTGEGRTR